MATSDLMRTGKSLARDVAGARAHVAIILIARQASGAEHQTLALARALQSHVRVTVLTCDEFAGLVATDPFLREYTRGLAIIALGPAFPVAPATTASGLLGRILAYPRLQQRLWTVWRQLRPDVVHLVLAPSFFAFAPWFLMRAGRTVITLAGEARYMRHFYGNAKRLAVRWAIARADRLVVCSADELVNLEVVAPGHSTRATVIDNFTDTARYRPAVDPAVSEPHAPVIIYAARLHPEKGARLFVEAMAEVVKRIPTVRALLYGQGEEAEDVERAIATLGLASVIERGFAVDMAPIMARGSIFVSCQLHENLGSSSLLEAMATGLAVVATDVGATRTIVDETIGAVVPPTAEGIASAVVALCLDPARRVACGVEARARVEARYGPAGYVAKLLPVYGDVIPVE